jgi:hypothetical protein
MENIQRPFSSEYVVRTTTKHMRKCIDISIKKTIERVSEFEGNSEKAQEIFKTLSMLHQMRKQLDVFQNTDSEN